MNLATERKIKFWIANIVKILIGVLVVFKISGYLLSDKKENTTQKNELSQQGQVKDSLKIVEKVSDNSTEIKKNVAPSKKVDSEGKSEAQVMQPKAINLDTNATSKDKTTKNMAVFIFGKDLHLNTKIKFQLQDQIFKNYNISANILPPSSVSQEVLESNLKSGNISILGNTLNKHTDYVCVGNVNTTFRTSSINSEIIICDIDLSYNVFNEKGMRKSDLSKSDTYTGQGFSKPEALKNAIKKIE